MNKYIYSVICLSIAHIASSYAHNDQSLKIPARALQSYKDQSLICSLSDIPSHERSSYAYVEYYDAKRYKTCCACIAVKHIAQLARKHKSSGKDTVNVRISDPCYYDREYNIIDSDRKAQKTSLLSLLTAGWL
jgi:hypothetical protein